MKALAKKAGGSFKTEDDRIHIVQRFSRHLRSLNIQIQRVEQIKVRHIVCYIRRVWRRRLVNGRYKMKWPRFVACCNRLDVSRWQSMSG